MPGPSGGGASQVNSLMDLIQPQAAADQTMNFVGYPPGFAQMGGVGQMAPGAAGPGGGGAPGGMPFDPRDAAYMPGAPWGMTRADLESPLSYMGGGPFAPPPQGEEQWHPRDYGGFFTLGQLYDFAPGGARAASQLQQMPSGGGGPGNRNPGGMTLMNRPPGGNVPGIFQFGSDRPSTNNWRLLGNDPTRILRNGMLIQVGDNARYGMAAGADRMANTAESGNMMPIRAVNPAGALSGNNVWSAMYWPGASNAFGFERYPAGTAV